MTNVQYVAEISNRVFFYLDFKASVKFYTCSRTLAFILLTAELQSSNKRTR